jgi:hypothetical protein
MKSHSQDIIGGIVALVVFFILSAIGQGEIASFALIAAIVCFIMTILHKRDDRKKKKEWNGQYSRKQLIIYYTVSW